MTHDENINRLKTDFYLYDKYLTVSMLLPKLSCIDVRNEYMTDITSFIFNELSGIFNENYSTLNKKTIYVSVPQSFDDDAWEYIFKNKDFNNALESLGIEYPVEYNPNDFLVFFKKYMFRMMEVSTALLDISYKLNDSDSEFDDSTSINSLINEYLSDELSIEMFNSIRSAIAVKGRVDTDRVITLDDAKSNMQIVYTKLIQEINNIENKSSYTDI